MNIHKIDSHLHQSFLEEERKDAITGDLIQANDEVVFCAICKSAFQKDSWEYMNRKHCGQTKTLNSIPVSKKLLLNVPLIRPVLVTLLGSSFSATKWKNHLLDFKIEDKKALINFTPDFIEGRRAFKKTVKKEVPPTKKRLPAKLRKIRVSKKHLTEQGYEFIKSPWYDSLYASVCIFPMLFTIIFLGASYETGVDEVTLWAIASLWLFPIFYFIYDFFKWLIKKKKNVKNVESIKEVGSIKKIEFIEKKAEDNKPTAQSIKEKKNDEVENYNKSTVFGIIDNKFFIYSESDNEIMYLSFDAINKTDIHYKSDLHLYCYFENESGTKLPLSLVFMSRAKLSKFLYVLAKQKKRFADKSEVNLIDFSSNKEKILKKKLGKYKEFIFCKPLQPVIKKVETLSYQEEKIIKLNDLSKIEKSQKVSKQSQNRNQHHQNKHQTQYRNYKRK